VALGFLLGINPVLAAIVFCLLTAWGIAWTSRRAEVKEDTAIVGLCLSYGLDTASGATMVLNRHHTFYPEHPILTPATREASLMSRRYPI
jgi:ABC-type Mn2+/Zn2+ transport system permease subunit